MSMEDVRDAAIEKAKKSGLIIKYTDPNTLLLDIDSEADFEKCRNQLKIAKKLCFIESAEYRRSKSKGYHVVCKTVETLTPIERIALQACLCSDPKRELLAINFLEEDGLAHGNKFSMLFMTGVEMTPIDLGA